MNPMGKRSVIEDISLGGRTAEEEAKRLSLYFVETEQWRKVWADEVDVIFAPKGGGKSAIYNMLLSREGELFDRGFLLVPGENPTGNTAFEPIQTEPATSEAEFIKIWRLYFLVLLVEELEKYEVESEKLTSARDALASIGLTQKVTRKRTIVGRIKEALGKLRNTESIEGGLSLDPTTLMPALSGKLTFGEPSRQQEEAGIVSVDHLYEDVNGLLAEQELSVWLMLDRLDVAFTASPELEANALRALFRVYKLMEPLDKLRLKIFLRSDIWSEITDGGFRETSHITRDMELVWNKSNLFKLIIQRILQSNLLIEELDVLPEEVIASSRAQQVFFDRIFPNQVDNGANKPQTFDWALSRIEDGKKRSAPRELIHLFSTVRDRQLDRIDAGHASIEGYLYFEPQSFREAHPEVSDTRLQRTIYPEYPWLKEWLEELRGQRTLQDLLSLEEIWGTTRGETQERIKRLLEVGFFEPRGSIAERTYWVPFLYRPALEMVQGTADSLRERRGIAENGGENEEDLEE